MRKGEVKVWRIYDGISPEPVICAYSDDIRLSLFKISSCPLSLKLSNKYESVGKPIGCLGGFSLKNSGQFPHRREPVLITPRGHLRPILLCEFD